MEHNALWARRASRPPPTGSRETTCLGGLVKCLKPRTETDTTTPGEEPKRDQWGSRFSFVISALGMSVGLGQVWRFPTLAYKNGGGTFVILYSILILTMGNALYYLEVSQGQYTGKSLLRVFDKVPLMIGLGWAMLAYCSIFVIYYNNLVAFAMYYLYASLTTVLPWTYCPEEDHSFYDPVKCYPFSKLRSPAMDGIVCGEQGLEYNRTMVCGDSAAATAMQSKCCEAAGQTAGCSLFNITDVCRPREDPAAYFWSHTVMREYRESDPHYGYLGEANGWLIASLFFSWLLTYVTLYKGLKSLRCVMYIMVPLPYVIMLIMLFAIIFEDGATEGLEIFFAPHFNTLANVDVWRSAVEQAFYSLGVSTGPIITFGSYRSFNAPSHKDSIFISIMIVLTSLLCSCVVFSILGVLSKARGVPFEEVTQIGPGLVFIVYPESLNHIGGSVFFSIMFYIMLINLGSSTASAILESLACAIYELKPAARRYKYLVSAGLVTCCFLLALPINFRGGLRVYEAIDIFAAGLALAPTGALELITTIYLYGIERFCEDCAYMTGYYPNRYYRYIWMVGPIFLLVIFTYGVVQLSLPFWRPWTLALGIMMFLFIFSFIPVGMVWQLWKRGWQYSGILAAPPDHGPKNAMDRKFRSRFSLSGQIF